MSIDESYRAISPNDRSLSEAVGNVTENAINKLTEKIPFVPKGMKNKVAKLAGAKVNSYTKSLTSKGNVTVTINGANPMGKANAPASTSGSGKNPPGTGADTRNFDNVDGVLTPRVDPGPEPYTFTLNTGIPAPIYGNIYKQCVPGFSTMYMTGLNFSINNDSFTVSNFFKTVVYPAFTSTIQRAISFQVPASFTVDNLLTWFNNVIIALQTYFFYKSIIAYADNPENRNDAMLNLRASITSDMLNSLYQLERNLLSTPLPPNVINFVWWLNQVYCLSELPGSALVKLIPVSATYDPALRTMTLNNASITSAISGLQARQDISSIIARATPWLNNSLPGYFGSAVFDLNFLTMWANSPHAAKQSSNSTASARLPQYSSSISQISYYSKTNTLDGAALALFTAYDTSNVSWLPNLIIPNKLTSTVAGDDDNRFVFGYQSSTGAGGWEAFGTAPASIGRVMAGFANYISASTQTTVNYTNHVPTGLENVLGVTVGSVNQCAIQLVEWLTSMDSVGTLSDNRTYNAYSNKPTIGIPAIKTKRRR